jgi:PPP family 3-phenylpropionic acid transporter
MSRAPLVPLYVLYFATVGVTLPWLPAYFSWLGFEAAQVGVLLALQPLAMLVFPPLWGGWADRSGRPDRVLRVLAFGAVLSLAPLLWVRRYEAMLVWVAAYAAFVSSVTPMLDSLAVRAAGRGYARLRLSGSVGFVLSTFGFGLWVDTVDERVVWTAWSFLAVFALASLALRAKVAPAAGRSPVSARSLLRDREIAALLLACALHWVACSPYHGSFAALVKEQGLAPGVVGYGVGLGVLAELGVMWLWPRLAGRWSTRRMLAVSFAVSGLRWAGMAVAPGAAVLVALQGLHGFTFAAFYLAAVAELSARVPEQWRASGQSLFAAVTFGLGGCVGFLSSGMLLGTLGGGRLFAAAAGLELLAAALALRLAPRTAEAPAPSALA